MQLLQSALLVVGGGLHRLAALLRIVLLAGRREFGAGLLHRVLGGVVEKVLHIAGELFEVTGGRLVLFQLLPNVGEARCDLLGLGGAGSLLIAEALGDRLVGRIERGLLLGVLG